MRRNELLDEIAGERVRELEMCEERDRSRARQVGLIRRALKAGHTPLAVAYAVMRARGVRSTVAAARTERNRIEQLLARKRRPSKSVRAFRADGIDNSRMLTQSEGRGEPWDGN